MTEPDPAETSPFVGTQPWPPSLVARKPSPVLPVMAGLAVVVLAAMVFLALRSPTANPPGDRTTVPPGAFAASPAGLPGAAPATAQLPAVTMPLPRDQGAPQSTAAMPAIGEPAAVAQPALPIGAVGPAAAPSADRYRGALVVIDAAQTSSAPAPAAASPAASADRPGATIGGSGETALGTQLGGGAASVTPTRLHDTARIAPQGTVIAAVLETGINSDLPGFVRAIVGRDVRGYDGTTVLIPRGSRLIGQYRNAVAVGQSRAFVVWSRLITPAGLSLDIQSPGTDATGRSGIAGETHSHFFRRFGNAILLSVLNAALQAGANSVASPGTAIVIGSQAQAGNVAALALQKDIDIAPTVIVNPGTPIRVFVARDLDFSGVGDKR